MIFNSPGFYDFLGEKWYQANDHPVALLRAENKAWSPWIIDEIEKRCHSSVKVLDIGCGAGFLSNPLAKAGHKVTGIDLSKESLLIAESKDETKRCHYLYGNALDLPFADESFDVITAMDILEHVEDPEKLVKEAARVLRPGGLFFFHTFNRTMQSYLYVIKAVQWCLKNCPQHLHSYEHFLQPKEVTSMCLKNGLHIERLLGLSPKKGLPFLKMLLTHKVPEDFTFRFSKSLKSGYLGIAIKGDNHGICNS